MITHANFFWFVVHSQIFTVRISSSVGAGGQGVENLGINKCYLELWRKFLCVVWSTSCPPTMSKIRHTALLVERICRTLYYDNWKRRVYFDFGHFERKKFILSFEKSALWNSCWPKIGFVNSHYESSNKTANFCSCPHFSLKYSQVNFAKTKLRKKVYFVDKVDFFLQLFQNRLFSQTFPK